MNNFKKVGLTALAGSLAMIGASQADVVLSGGAEVTYTTDGGTADLTGNPLGASFNIGITGTGELDNGWTFTAMTDFSGQNTTVDSAYIKFDMGDLGTIGIDQGAGYAGIGTLGNEVPTAYEEAGHGVSGSGHSLDGQGDTNALTYKSPTVMGLTLDLEYHPTINATAKQEAGAVSAAGNSNGYNYAVTWAPEAMSGLTLAYGSSITDDQSAASANDDEEMTMAINYVVGSISLGYQVSEVQTGGAGENGNNVEEFGIALAVNENLSVSYNSMENEDDATAGTSNITEDSTGLNAAYTMGSASFRIAMNEADNVNGVSGTTDENLELSLSLSF